MRAGKARGIAVTCEVTPHHFILTDEALEGYDTNVKMNPPLRDGADRDEMIRGIVDGSVDVLATDHAPHHQDEKGVEFDRAPFGIVGLETAVSLTFDRLVHPGLITMRRFVELLVGEPGARARRDGRLARGRAAGRHQHPGAGSAASPSTLRGSSRRDATRRSAAGRFAAASPPPSSPAASSTQILRWR